MTSSVLQGLFWGVAAGAWMIAHKMMLSRLAELLPGLRGWWYVATDAVTFTLPVYLLLVNLDMQGGLAFFASYVAGFLIVVTLKSIRRRK